MLNLGKKGRSFKDNRTVVDNKNTIDEMIGKNDAKISKEDFTPEVQQKFIERSFGVDNPGPKQRVKDNQVVVNKEEFENLKQTVKKINENPSVVEGVAKREFGIKDSPSTPTPQQNVSNQNDQPTQENGKQTDEYQALMNELGIDQKSNRNDNLNSNPKQPRQRRANPASDRLNKIRKDYATKVTKAALANNVDVKKLNNFIQGLEPTDFVKLFKANQGGNNNPNPPTAQSGQQRNSEQLPNLASQKGKQNVPVYRPFRSASGADRYDV